jgi:hypothetical protein
MSVGRRFPWWPAAISLVACLHEKCLCIYLLKFLLDGTDRQTYGQELITQGIPPVHPVIKCILCGDEYIPGITTTAVDFLE